MVEPADSPSNSQSPDDSVIEPGKSVVPKSVAAARRRLGFVALLWWIAAVTGTIGLIQRLQTSRARVVFIGISWVLALFFSYAWREVRKGLPE